MTCLIFIPHCFSSGNVTCITSIAASPEETVEVYSHKIYIYIYIGPTYLFVLDRVQITAGGLAGNFHL